MQNVTVQRYSPPIAGFSAHIEPADKSWSLWVGADGKPLLFPRRDESGAAVDGVGLSEDSYQER